MILRLTGMFCIYRSGAGRFFVINRSGKLEIRKYGKESVMEIGQKHRFSSSSSDFVTRYTAVSSTNMKTQIAEYYAVDPDDGLTMNLGINTLIQFGVRETREEICRNILDSLGNVNYVPFDSETIGNPALDLGDVLVLSGGQADGTKMTCITFFECKIGGKQKLKCVGKNPRLAQAKSKHDKNIAGLLNQVEAGKIGIHTFTNADAYSIGNTRVRIISIDFATKEENHAEFFGQVIVNVNAVQMERTANAQGTVVVPIPVSEGSDSSEDGTRDVEIGGCIASIEKNEDGMEEKWLKQLLAPGSSLGGARPKASVSAPDGSLWIA